MKNKLLKFVLITLACFGAFASCSDDKSDFEGDDCYFVSFSLTADGVAYPAKITGTQILLEVPYGVDLSEATVSYKLNENATVLPNPAKVSDWTTDQVFRVQAYNDSYNTFTYSLSVVDVSTTENITLLTQADVDNFADKNINVINGNLIIGEKISSVGEESAIKNLDGLWNLTHVGYNVIINDSFDGTNIEGLSNLKKVGGFYMGSTTTRSNPKNKVEIALPNIESIGTFVVNSDSVTKITLPKVTEISDMYVKSQFLESILLTNLKSSYGNLTIEGINNSLKELLLPNLSKVYGALSLYNLRGLSVVNISALQEVEGNCEIKSLNALELINFPLLKRVGGDFLMTGNLAMTKIVAPELESAKLIKISSESMYSNNLKDIILSKLSSTQSDLSLLYIGGEKVELPLLEKIGGTFTLQSTPYLTSLETPKLNSCSAIRFTGVNQLKSADFSQVKDLTKMEVYSSAALTRLALPQTIVGNLTISSSGNSASFIDFGALEIIEGALAIDGFTQSTLTVKKIKKIGSFSFIKWNRYIETVNLTDLEQCGDFAIGNMDVLHTLSMPLLTQTKSFSITECPLLLNMNIPLLKKIEGELKLQGSRWGDEYQIANLNDFSALTSVGSVTISYAPLLNDFTGLKSVVKGLDSSKWSVSDCKYNPTLQDMLDGKYAE